MSQFVKNRDNYWWKLYEEIIACVSDCFREAAEKGDYSSMFKAAEMIMEYWRRKGE